MSTLQNTPNSWSIASKGLESKYEKCLNITEEIYKRINITFQIKKLEGNQSDVSNLSDQIDSNDLSNETDLFACDKSSISSSTDAERPQITCEKYINNNNNEETKKKFANTTRKPRKRFRKRVKKRQSKSNRSDSDGSSDEAPLSHIIETDLKTVKANHVDSPHNIMGVPNIVIVANLKPKLFTPDKKNKKDIKDRNKTADTPNLVPVQKKNEIIKKEELSMTEENVTPQWKNCPLCSLSFKGERGLRRHMALSHIINSEEDMKLTR